MIQSPQVYALQPTLTDNADWQITTAGTLTGEWTDGLIGMSSVAVELRFLWGSGGTNVTAILQSALGPDMPAYDVATVTFLAHARTVLFELYGGTGTTLHDAGFGGVDAIGNDEPDGVVCAVLGDRLRLMLIVTGTYLNTVLSARVIPK